MECWGIGVLEYWGIGFLLRVAENGGPFSGLWMMNHPLEGIFILPSRGPPGTSAISDLVPTADLKPLSGRTFFNGCSRRSNAVSA
jgi:hypothetical protein